MSGILNCQLNLLGKLEKLFTIPCLSDSQRFPLPTPPTITFREQELAELGSQHSGKEPVLSARTCNLSTEGASGDRQEHGTCGPPPASPKGFEFQVHEKARQRIRRTFRTLCCTHGQAIACTHTFIRMYTQAFTHRSGERD